MVRRISRAAGHWSLLAVLLAGSAAAQTPVGTAFTYQGRLLETSVPSNGSYDFRFTLYDAPAAGNVVGGPLTLPGVAVAQGLFTVPLDFGSSAFQGQARFLEIEVQVTGGGGFTLLTPRQELRPSPGSVFSSYTDPANLTILNASNLTSGTVPDARLAGTYAQPLSLTNAANAMNGNFTGDGFALTNLNADNLASGTVPGARLSGTYPNPVTFPDAGNFFSGDGSGLFNLNAQPKYVRTVVVSPVGTPVENGAALLTALAGITTASAANPWLLKIEPGIYDVGATSFVMKPFVDVEGSGEAVTRITGVGNGLNTVGTVQVVADTELRFLTVENTGGAAYAKPIFVDGASPRITHVTALGSGGTTQSQGVYVQGPASPVIRDVTIRTTATGSARSYAMYDSGASSVQINLNTWADGGDVSLGVYNCCGGTPTMRNVVATATGAVTQNRGVFNSSASPLMENVVATGSGAAAASLGVWNFGSSSPTLRFVTCRGSGGTSQSIGCYATDGAQPTMEDVLAEGVGSGIGSFAFGVRNLGAGAVVKMSRVRALASGASVQNSAVWNQDCSPQATDLELVASGSGVSEVFGVVFWSASGSLDHFTASATGSTTDFVAGIVSISSAAISAPALVDGVVSATGSSTNTFGVWNDNNTTPTLERVRVSVQGGGGFSLGVLNDTASQVSLTDVTSTATGPGGTIAGIYNFGAAAVQMAQVVATGTGAAGNVYGLASAGGSPSTVTVDRSTLTGVTNSVFNSGNSGLRIGGSQLVGLVTTAAGSSTTCVLSYNGGYAPVNALCQ